MKFGVPQCLEYAFQWVRIEENNYLVVSDSASCETWFACLGDVSLVGLHVSFWLPALLFEWEHNTLGNSLIVTCDDVPGRQQVTGQKTLALRRFVKGRVKHLQMRKCRA